LQRVDLFQQLVVRWFLRLGKIDNAFLGVVPSDRPYYLLSGGIPPLGTRMIGEGENEQDRERGECRP
jgi:hypothetical protein